VTLSGEFHVNEYAKLMFKTHIKY